MFSPSLRATNPHVRELFDPPDNEVENIRLRTDDYELIAAQHGHFTLIVVQEDLLAKAKKEAMKEDEE